MYSWASSTRFSIRVTTALALRSQLSTCNILMHEWGVSELVFNSINQSAKTQTDLKKDGGINSTHTLMLLII